MLGATVATGRCRDRPAVVIPGRGGHVGTASTTRLLIWRYERVCPYTSIYSWVALVSQQQYHSHTRYDICCLARFAHAIIGERDDTRRHDVCQVVQTVGRRKGPAGGTCALEAINSAPPLEGKASEQSFGCGNHSRARYRIIFISLRVYRSAVLVTTAAVCISIVDVQ